jgi:hypothetical protein
VRRISPRSLARGSMAGLLLYLRAVFKFIISMIYNKWLWMMLGYSKLENLSTQFFMVLIMLNLLLTFMHVCMLRLWDSRISAITQTRNAFRRGCMPLSACGCSGSIMHDGRISRYTSSVWGFIIIQKILQKY